MTIKIEVPSVPRGAEALLGLGYAKYLDIRGLWRIQSSEQSSYDLHHEEEFFFRTVHLTCELWLRQTGFELEQVITNMDEGRLGRASRKVRRAASAIDRVVDATLMFESMPVAEYHAFRVQFENEASGLQSPGYAYVRQVNREVANALDRLIATDEELFDVYSNQIDGPLYVLCEELLNLDARFIDGPLYVLCEELLNLDARFDRFRAAHLHIAKRFLHENTIGTGGKGIEYLRGNVGATTFPRLWEVREQLADAGGAESYVR